MGNSEFFTTDTVQNILLKLFSLCEPLEDTETISTYQSLGRIVAVSPLSPVNLPEFVRSSMDGYAVRATDTFGASQSLPAYLELTHPVKMGEKPSHHVGRGQASVIHTGGMLPDGADAVVMIERTQKITDKEIEVLAPVAQGENLVQIGEDVYEGEPILPVGHSIRPQDIGGLLAVGVEALEIKRKPNIAIMGSGDEVVHPRYSPEYGQVRDINSYTLRALFEMMGAEVTLLGISPDEFEKIRTLAEEGISQADILVITAGSSVSTRDYTYNVIAELGSPGILQHGLAVKPGKPTIIAMCDGKAVFGLPGNPVSAFLVARQLIVPLVHYLMGEKVKHRGIVRAELRLNIPSTTGRLDTVPVKLQEENGRIFAQPIFGKSNLIFTLIDANGVVEVPLNSNGLTAGTIVEVYPF